MNKKERDDIYVGMKYFDFTVISRDDSTGGNGRHYHWNLLCKCGRLLNVTSHAIQQGSNPRCACQKKFKNLTGFIFGKVIVCGFAGYDLRHGRKKPQWFYQCTSCGLIKIHTSDVLIRGCIKTCGNKGCKPKGDGSPRWKPNAIVRNTRRDGRHKIWSRSVFERDNFSCVCCGQKSSKNVKIQSHHLNGWHWCEKGRFDVNNGVTLCKGKLSGCHYDFHKKYGNENNTKEQFAEFLLENFNKNLDSVLGTIAI